MLTLAALWVGGLSPGRIYMTSLVAQPHIDLEPGAAFRLTRTIERICGLPGVATPHWCERAAEAILPLAASRDDAVSGVHDSDGEMRGAALVAISQPSAEGQDARIEEAGVAGVQERRAKRLLAERFARPARGALAFDAPLGGRLIPSECDGWKVWTADCAPCAASEGAAPRSAWAEAQAARVLTAAVAISGARFRRFLLVEVGVAPALAPQWAATEPAVISAACALARRASVAFASDHERITRREEQVLDLLIHGLSVQEIARRLCRSPHTIHDHVKSLHRKVGATSRGELIARALGAIGVDQPTAAA